MNNDKELKACGFTKTILMIVIVLYHSVLAWNGNWFNAVEIQTENPLSMFAKYLGSFHIYAFVLVSGYIFYYSRCECGKYGCFSAFVKNKFKRLIVPYLAVSAFWVVPIGMVFFKYGFWDIVTKFIFATSPNQLWFLVMLFWVFLIFWNLTPYIKNHFLPGFVLACIAYAIGVFGNAFVPNVFQIWTALKYIIFFWLGFVIRQYKLTRLNKTWPLWVILHVCLFVLSQSSNKFGDGYLMKAMNIGLDLSVNVVGVIAVFAAMQYIGVRIGDQSKALRMLGKTSMPIYLLHQQIIYISIYLLNGLVNPYIHSVINFCVALALSFVVSLFLMKFRVTSLLIGEKNVKKEV